MSMTALISSVNTQFYVISSPDDKDGQQVNTKNGKDSPSGSVRAQLFIVAYSSNSSVTRDFFGQVLLITPGINGPITVATISSTDSDGRLFISLNVSLHPYLTFITTIGLRLRTSGSGYWRKN